MLGDLPPGGGRQMEYGLQIIFCGIPDSCSVMLQLVSGWSSTVGPDSDVSLVWAALQ